MERPKNDYFKRNERDGETKLFWIHFDGKKSPVNKFGGRNFAVEITQDEAEYYEDRGWKIGQRAPIDDESSPTYFINASASFNYNYPSLCPKVKIVTPDGQTFLAEEEFDILDYISTERYNEIYVKQIGLRTYRKQDGDYAKAQLDYMEIHVPSSIINYSRVSGNRNPFDATESSRGTEYILDLAKNVRERLLPHGIDIKATFDKNGDLQIQNYSDPAVNEGSPLVSDELPF